MELHEKFEHKELRETIFGVAPEYKEKYVLAIYLRRTVILAATLIRAYYKNKHNKRENMTSRSLDRIVERPYISIDNSISALTAVQSAGNELDEIGLAALRMPDETQPQYVNLYEAKAVLQDESGKFFNAAVCKQMLEKVVACVPFLFSADIGHDGEKTELIFGGERFDISDLFKYEFSYSYVVLEDVDPIKTTFQQL